MTAAAPAAPLGLLAHVVQTLRLAVPVMLARAGLVILITVDTVMCGAAGGDALAFYGASLAPHITMLTVGIGLLTGTVVYVAQMAGAGRPAIDPRPPEHVVALSALRVRQDLVRLARILEPSRRLGILVDVGVPLLRELAEGALDLGVARAARDAKDLV